MTTQDFPLIHYLRRTANAAGQFIREDFKQLLEGNVDLVNQQDVETGETALMISVKQKNYDAMRELLGYNKVINISLKDKQGNEVLNDLLLAQSEELLSTFLTGLQEDQKRYVNTEKLSLIHFRTAFIWCMSGSCLKSFHMGLVLLQLKLELKPKVFEGERIFHQLISGYVSYVQDFGNRDGAVDEVLKVLTEFIKLCLGGGASLNEQARRENAVLHVLCLRNLPRLLEVFLQVAKDAEVDLGEHLNGNQATNRQSQTPLLVCCDKHDIYSDGRTLRRCAELLIDFGTDVNGTQNTMIPLKACFSDSTVSRNQQEVACVLIGRQADIDMTFMTGLHLSEQVILLQADLVVETLIKSGKIKLDEPLPQINELPLKLAAQLFCESMDSPTGNFGFAPPNLDLVKLFMRYNSPTRETLFYAMFFGQKGTKQIIKLLVDAGADLNDEVKNAMSLLMAACIRREFDLFKLFLFNGADPTFVFKVKVCQNTPAHRNVKYETVLQALVALGKNPEFSAYICDVCLKKMQEKEAMLLCTVDECNFSVCEDCVFFQRGTNFGGAVGIYEMAERISDVKVLSLLNYVTLTPVGRQMVKKQLGGHLDILLNASIGQEELLKKLSPEHFTALGVPSSEEQKKLLAILA